MKSDIEPQTAPDELFWHLAVNELLSVASDKSVNVRRHFGK